MTEKMQELEKRISLLSQQGRFKDVEPLLVQVTDRARAEYGESDPRYAGFRNDLGGLLKLSQRIGEAPGLTGNFGAVCIGLELACS